MTDALKAFKPLPGPHTPLLVTLPTGELIGASLIGMSHTYGGMVILEFATPGGISGTACLEASVLMGMEGTAGPLQVMADSFIKQYNPPDVSIFSGTGYAKSPDPMPPPADLSQIEADLAKLPASYAIDEPLNSTDAIFDSFTEALDKQTKASVDAILQMGALKAAMDTAQQPSLAKELEVLFNETVKSAAEAILYSEADDLEEVLKDKYLTGQYHVKTPNGAKITIKLKLEVSNT